jgi:hypothetical protein
MHSLFNESYFSLLNTACYCVKQLSNVLEAACRAAGIPTQCSGLKNMIGYMDEKTRVKPVLENMHVGGV